MGKIADDFCDEIILTNEDPYDENPEKIVNEVKAGIKDTPVNIIMDRKQAIASAISMAKNISKEKVAILITGKGTDPYIMQAKGKKIPWSDYEVTKEEMNRS